MIAIRSSAAIALVVGLGFSGLAAAQAKVWSFTDVTAPGACATTGGSGTGIGNTRNCYESTQQAPAATSLAITAWANTGAGSTYAAGAVTGPWAGNGIGVGNAAEGGTNAASGNGDHSLDNGNGNGSDLLLLSFTSAQVLKQVTLGWTGADGDFDVLRWTGGAFNAATNLAGKTASQLVSSGWSLVSTVNGAGGISTPDQTYGINATNQSSSYWLISAFNSSFGGSGATAGVDSIKLMGVTAAANRVAEPGSLALAGIALAGVAGLRRRRAQAAA